MDTIPILYNTADIKKKVDEKGVVILRCSEIDTIEKFANVAKLFGNIDVDMSCSAGPRINLGYDIFTSNEAPPDQSIPPHHEMAQCEHPPSYILFYCDTPSPNGGCTPVIDSSHVAAHFKEKFPCIYSRLKREGVKYLRQLPAYTDFGSPLGKSWKDTYNVSTCEELEKHLYEQKIEWKWLPNDVLQTISQPQTLFKKNLKGDEILFCAAETSFLNISSENKKELLFGNGDPLDSNTKKAFEYIGTYAFDNSFRVKWEKKDVMIINNFMVMHSRDPFVKPRKICVALVE